MYILVEIKDTFSGGLEGIIHTSIFCMGNNDVLPNEVERLVETCLIWPSSPGMIRLAGSITTFKDGDCIAISSAWPLAAVFTTFARSGSKAKVTCSSSAIRSAASMEDSRSDQAWEEAFSGCQCHMFSGSRDPVQSVMMEVPMS